MKLEKLLQRQVRNYVPVVAKDGLVLIQQVFYVFKSSGSIKKNRFMPENDGYSPPTPVREFLQIDIRAMMRVHDKTFNPDAQEMIHYVSDYRAPPDVQKRFRALLCQGPKPRAKTCAQDEGGFESFFVIHAPILTQVARLHVARLHVTRRRLQVAGHTSHAHVRISGYGPKFYL